MVDVLSWIFGLPPAPWWLPLISFPSVAIGICCIIIGMAIENEQSHGHYDFRRIEKEPRQKRNQRILRQI